MPSIDLSGASMGTMRPLHALLFYGDGVDGRTDRPTRVAVTRHPLRVNEGRVVAQPGRLLDRRDIADILADFENVGAHAPALLPDNVLVSTPSLTMWWIPAGRRLMYFDIDWHKGTKGRERLQGRKGEMPYPALVFAMTARRTVYVFAMDRNERPREDTMLYRCPLPNINDSGWVCWGSGAMPDGPPIQNLRSIQDAFFTSTFSHLNQSPMMRLQEGETAYSFWADLLDRQRKTFPLERLRPDAPLNQILVRLARSAQ